MKILFIHKNYPAQFGSVGHWLSERGWDVTFATQRDIQFPVGPRVLRWPELPPAQQSDPLLDPVMTAIREARHFAGHADTWRRQGYIPQIVVAHSGWSCGSFVKDIWPDAKFIPYFEWHYAWPPRDSTPHSRSVDRLERRHINRLRNVPIMMDVDAADAMIVPTQFQRDQFPAHIAKSMTVLPDGIDTRLNAPGPRDAAFLNRHGIPADSEIVTYVARGMEPSRGFPEMMRLVGDLLERRPTTHVIVVGQDRVAYGDRSEKWKQKMLDEVKPDIARLHFTGLLSRSELIRVYRASDLHLYLSAAFVTSWSLQEAMACEAPILASDNDASKEYIRDGENGFLCDPYDRKALLARAVEVLDHCARAQDQRRRARLDVVENAEAETVAFPRKEAFLKGILAD